MIINKSLFLLTFILLSSLPLSSQVKIKLNIENNNDSIYYLLKYKGDKTYSIIDSCSYSDNYTFKNDIRHDEGIYIVAGHKQKPLTEILIGEDQNFSISIKDLMDLNTYKAKGSKATSKYFKINARSTHYKLYIKALENEIDYNPNNVDKIDSLKNVLHEYQESMLEKNNSFINTYIKFIEDVTIPRQLKKDAAASSDYMIEHYFDELPLCDERILNSRLLKDKLDDYFDNVMASQSSELTCRKIDDLITMTSECQDIRDYILWYLYSKYFNHKNIEHENTFIHLVDNYFSKIEINNLTPIIKKMIIERANILKDITKGHLIPDLSYIDENGDEASLKDIVSRNTVILFHKNDCHKCHKAKRILSNIENKNKDVKVVYVDISEEDANRDIIKRYDIMTIPTIYIIDEEKRIVTKHIEAEEVEFYLQTNRL